MRVKSKKRQDWENYLKVNNYDINEHIADRFVNVEFFLNEWKNDTWKLSGGSLEYAYNNLKAIIELIELLGEKADSNKITKFILEKEEEERRKGVKL